MTNRPAKGLTMREHAFDHDSGRCTVCGQLADSAAKGCPGVPAEEQATPEFKLPNPDGFLLPHEWDADRDAADDYFVDEYRNPDEPAFNVLCPVCMHRPCREDCRIGLTQADMDELNRLFPEEK